MQMHNTRHPRFAQALRLPGAILILLGAILSLPARAGDLHWLNDVPDLDQRRQNLPNSGKFYCVPTAATNWMYYLANHGDSSVIPGSDDPMNYNDATGNIATLGNMMGIDPNKGTTLNGTLDGIEAWLSQFSYKSYTLWSVNFLSDDPLGLGFHALHDLLSFGPPTMPIVGWYTNEGNSDLYTRTGGHVVSLRGTLRNDATRKHGIAINDSSRDETPDDLNAQSPFTTQWYGVHYQLGVFNAKYGQLARIEGYSNGFLEGFIAIVPLFLLTNVDNTFHVYWDPNRSKTVPQPIQGNVEEIHLHPCGYKLYSLILNPCNFWETDLTTGQSRLVLEMHGVKRFIVAPNLRFYLLVEKSATESEILRVNSQGGVEARVTVPAALEGLLHNPCIKAIIGISHDRTSRKKRLHVYTEALLPDGESFLGPTVPGSGKLNVQYCPGKNALVFHHDGSTQAAFLKWGTPMETGLITLREAAAPQSLVIDDRGTLLFRENGVIRGYDITGARSTRSPFIGQAVGSLLDVPRRFNNFTRDSATDPNYLNTAPNVAVSGRVHLLEFRDPVQQAITIEIRPLNGGQTRREAAILDEEGAYILFDMPPGPYDLAFKGSRWLQKVVRVTVRAGQETRADVELIPGDANGDNSINIFDLAALAEAFNAVPGDRNWDANTDWNGDDSTDIFDLATLAKYFNQDGDR